MAPSAQPSFVILGGGPAGLAAAYKLAGRGWRHVTVLERGARVGGNAGSFVVDGIPVDFGSHRLHPVTPPDVMGDIRSLLGADLLDRPRHGRIRLRGRFVHFPLKPFDLLTGLPPSFMAGVIADSAAKLVTRPSDEPTFASILERGLGRTICRDFYFPYAQKIWGLAPEALDPEQAKRRISNSSLGKMVRKVLSALPGAKRPAGAGRFYYPRLGFGQISDALHAGATAGGATVHLEAQVTGVSAEGRRVRAIEATVAGESRTFPADFVLSTIPVTALAGLVRTDGPPAPLEAVRGLRSRAMVLIYLTLDTNQFTEFDAHYFPESSIRISRLSEPKNYSLTSAPGRTVLCAELPCAVDDPEWSASDEELGRLMVRDLETAGLGPVPRVLQVQTRRLPQAYPLYTRGYREAFDAVDRWIGTIGGLVTFGRQGLFAHDNTHHTMAMAYALVQCLSDDGAFDTAAWARARTSFEDHVVED
ncbi:MAG: FAD-dependent oxidoreductase [Vicinamibacterales bacterium]